MADVDDVVFRLHVIAVALDNVAPDNFAERHRLLGIRDELRAEAEEFAQRKDENKTDAEVVAELVARRRQLDSMKGQRINRVYQAGAGGGGAAGLGVVDGRYGGDINIAMMRGMGADEVNVRIAELEQELKARGIEPPRHTMIDE